MFNDMFWGGMWFNNIFWLVIIGVVVWLIVNSRNSSHNKSSANKNFSQTPIEILKLRYAKGEITKEEFEIMKKDLTE